MQEVVYKCDYDKKEIGRKPHITLRLSAGTATGIAVPQRKDGWETHPLNRNFLHFCNGQCIGRYFADLLRDIKVSTKK